MAESQDDPRFKIKDIIDAMALTKDNDSDAATELFMYSDGEEHFEDLFDTYDVLFLIGPWREVPSRHEANIPHHESYMIPITVVTIDKTGVTGTIMQWKADVGLRALIEANAQPGSGVRIEIDPDARPTNQRIGGVTIYKTVYTIRYKT